MEYEIEFGGGTADVEITLSGSATPAAFRRFTETLAADPQFRAGLRMLVDVSSLDTTALSADGLQGLTAPVLERDWYYPPAAVAIVAGRGEIYGDAKTYRAHLGGSRSNRQIFEDRGEALRWLEAQRPPPGEPREEPGTNQGIP
jgi:hypothetical protein